MLLKILFSIVSTGFVAASPAPQQHGSHCPPISGDFNVTYFRLYSEGFDYDSIHCKAYFGGNFNATVLKKDLATGEETLLKFPGISGNPVYHVSGIEFNRAQGAMYFSANNGGAFSSKGVDRTGPNHLIKWDTYQDKVAWVADLSPITAEIHALTGYEFNGFQDMAQDLAGNTYIMTAFGHSIAKITPDGKPSLWYYNKNPTPSSDVGFVPPGNLALGWNGIFSIDNTLVLPDVITSKLWTFDTTAKIAAPKLVAPKNLPINSKLACDRSYPPPMFNGEIFLCSNDFNGTAVYYSSDCWKSAEYLGLVPSKYDGIPTASAQISNSLYSNNEYLFDLGLFDIQPGGNRSVFPFQDITSPVKALYAAATAKKGNPL
ncbi:hypothetical protein BKA61DRAFT_683166 [Leptodontidium sp. MPI-SDFR-AT-0119]|nr:hypothetical protein BKA61DRAFT_683166 [Leptodontidium sp. MPI-SDFR-AT-0119]